jgi:AcrR family transcriptional regulator
MTTTPRWTRRKEARPADLVDAALDLFVERGYAATRLEDVARRAGVAKGTLYLYFENKEALLKAVVRENIVARISEAREEAATMQADSATVLRHLVLGWWQCYGATKCGDIGKLMMAESGNFPEIAAFFVAEVIEPWHRLIGEVIARGIASGEFRPVEIPTFVRVLVAPLVMLSLWQRSFGPCSRGAPVDAEHYLETALDAFLVSLRALPRDETSRSRRETSAGG